MNKSTSIYLDLIRFTAAVTVFLVHANYDRFTGGMSVLWYFSHLGNDAVMVFFVLSGFVINYVSNTKEHNLTDYFTSRFARLYSVALPALFFTILSDTIGSRVSFIIYDGGWYETSNPALRIISSLLFINELWFYSIRPFSNGPFWSISYEFWYYVLFGISFYIKTRIKYVLIPLVCLFIGPKILILFPVWAMGAYAYKITSSKNIDERLGWTLFITSIVGYFAYRLGGGQRFLLEQTQLAIGESLYNNLSWSRRFTSCYIIGFFVSLNFIGFASVSHRLKGILTCLEKPIRYAASYTFILYLMHYPLLQLFSALTFDSTSQRTQPAIVIAGPLITIWMLGGVTEKQKGNYKKAISLIMLKFNSFLTNNPKTRN